MVKISNEFAYPYYVVGYGFTEEEAWNEFWEEFEVKEIYINGNHYWRTVPQLDSNIDFDTNRKEYRVVARIVATFKDAKDLVSTGVKDVDKIKSGLGGIEAKLFGNVETTDISSLTPKGV